MARPTSFRLPVDLLAQLDAEAAAARVPVSALVISLLDEGLKTRRFPGIVYRDGPTGRRAGLIGGPDVWEIVRALRETSGRGEQRIERLAKHRELPIAHVHLAVDFYASSPEEIDARIALDEQMAEQLRTATKLREELIS